MLAAFGPEAGKRLRQARLARGWSLRVAAQYLDTTEKTLGTWEHATADPGRRNNWPKIEEVYEVSRAEILGEPEPAQLDRLESEVVNQRLMLEALLDSIRPDWRGLLRRDETPPPPDEDPPQSDPEPDEPESPPQDLPPRRS